MKINKLTITGADDKVHQSELISLSKEYNFIEWAILFTKTKIGEPRYPTEKYIDTLINDSRFKLAAHFCGWYAKQVLEESNFELISKLPDNFERVQLNYNFKHSTGYDLDKLLEFAKSNQSRAIILQYNKSNEEVLKEFATKDLPSNIHFLYDSSGGNGKEIERIGTSIGNQYTGYAGGITPDNVEKICNMIQDDGEQVETWIDLESGVRTNNEFDLIKAVQIIETVNKFI
jgi:phosphoribosylanthranilate isomerase